MNRTAAKAVISAVLALSMGTGQLALAQGKSNHNKIDRGVGPNHEYYRGDRLPAEFRHRHHVVNDWRGHSLSAPPRGYHWVQSGGDYILIASATGIIAQFLLGK